MVTVTKSLLSEYIEFYHTWKSEIEDYENKLHLLGPAAATAKYGIEATMPRGGSGISDPTFNQATKTTDDYIRRRQIAIKEMNKRIPRVKGVIERDVLELWMQGCTLVETANRLNKTKSTVHRYREKIIDCMMGDEKDGYTSS